jgi:hypothetical protein
MEMTEQERDEFVAAKLLRTAGRAALTVQTETPHCQYVMASGPVTIDSDRRDEFAMASRDLGPELGRSYADNKASTEGSVQLRPEQWITCDYGTMQR